MTEFEALMTTHPRPSYIFVKYELDRDGNDKYDWGLMPGADGKFPLLSFLGGLVRAQTYMLSVGSTLVDDDHECPESAFILTWDDRDQECKWFVHPSIPIDPLVGMIETIKFTIIQDMKTTKQARQQSAIVGLDGKPIRR